MPMPGGGRAHALAVAGIPLLGAAGGAGRIVLGGIRQNLQLALHVHLRTPLIPLVNPTERQFD